MQYAKHVRSGETKNTVKVILGDIEANVEPDSGASINVMDEYQFRALAHRSTEIKQLQPSQEILKTLQSDLQDRGEFEVTIRNKNRDGFTTTLV